MSEITSSLIRSPARSVAILEPAGRDSEVEKLYSLRTNAQLNERDALRFARRG